MPSKNDLRSKYRNRYSFYIPDKNKKYTLSAVSILSLCFSNITCIFGQFRTVPEVVNRRYHAYFFRSYKLTATHYTVAIAVKIIFDMIYTKCSFKLRNKIFRVRLESYGYMAYNLFSHYSVPKTVQTIPSHLMIVLKLNFAQEF